MRILVRTSRWAIWARRLGSFALPLAILPVLMHRGQSIGTDTFEIVEIVAILVAFAALLTSIVAFVRIWVTGDEGWGRAITGLVFSLACFAPLGLLAADYVLYPLVDEVSTDSINPPPLTSGLALTPTPVPAAQAVALRFPNIKTRHYPIPADQMFAVVDKLVIDRGWDVRLRRAPEAGADGQINAIDMTLLGFRDEVSIRVSDSDDGSGSAVDMRCASLTSLHEPGVNGSRVEGFLSALDARMTVLMKVQPAGAADDTDVDSQTDNAPVIPAPAPRGRKR
ncbi:MAG: DUF1499 domain-containing protein [Devosia sp.]